MQTLRCLAILPALMMALGLIALNVAPAVELKLSTVKVTVLDSTTKAPLVRAIVSLSKTRGAYTNDKGVATILKVKPGTYDLKVKYLGYADVNIRGFVVSDSIVSRTIAMNKAQGDSVIIVNGGRILTEKSNTEQGRKFSVSEVENTPGRQRLEEIVKLTPGVMTDNANGRSRVNGNRGYQNSMKINGIEMQGGADANGSTVQNSLSKFAISELDIMNSGKDAATSTSLGCVISTTSNEEYKAVQESPYKLVSTEPLSTFSIDVDRASYANVRRFLNDNMLPPKDAVRIEEMINYFHYDLPQPEGSDPIAIFTDMAACPWNEKRRIVQVSLKGREIAKDNLPPANLVFLIDVSGSMDSRDKLPLLKSAFRMLVEQLREEDKVSIVTYAGNAGLVLPATHGNEKAKILEAIDRLTPGGSTAGAAGIQLAYQIAKDNKTSENNTRVILATDGDFNVGVSSDEELVKLIEAKREEGIFLTVMGFGTGNYKDSKMEQLADKGNGNYSYCDNLLEAQKTFVTELGGTLNAIAKDVKIQIEFNPKYVQAYRLIGYDNRLLRKEDFNNDKIDAGELGAGHEVTALYEIIPPGVENDPALATVDPLKYQQVVTPIMHVIDNNEMMTVKFRYKDPADSVSKLVTKAVMANESLQATENLRWSMAVAQFGMLLRGSEHKGNANISNAIDLANAAKGKDHEGYRAEFIKMLKIYELLSKNTSSVE
jgi:Ca-activated chloride channel homolog